jgi:hypothetical protein
MADRSEIVPDEAIVNKQTFTTCAKCGLLIVGQFVRALGGTYHLECFKCQVTNHRTTKSLRISHSLRIYL